MKNDICPLRQQHFIKLLNTSVLAKAGEKGKASVTTDHYSSPFMVDFPDDVSLLRFRISISIDFVGLENAVMSLAFQETF